MDLHSEAGTNAADSADDQRDRAAARFNALKDRLIAATGSPGLASFESRDKPDIDGKPDGTVHMPLGEWERLIDIIQASQSKSTALAKALRNSDAQLAEEQLASAKLRVSHTKLRVLCDNVEYKVSGRHETWDSFHEGRSSFADEVDTVLDQAALDQTQ